MALTFDATGATKLCKRAEELKCDTNGDINLRNAWTRRNLAFEGAQVQIWSARVLQVRGERPYNQCEHGLGTQLGEPTAEKRQATFAEFFSGSGSFSQAMRKEGFQVFPVDHNANRFAPKVPTFNIDSSNSDEVKVAVQLFIVLVHCVLEGSSLFDIPFWLKDFHLYVYFLFWCLLRHSGVWRFLFYSHNMLRTAVFHVACFQCWLFHVGGHVTILTCFCGIPGGPGRHGLCFGLDPFSGTINHCFVDHCERIVPSISHSFEFYSISTPANST